MACVPPPLNDLEAAERAMRRAAAADGAVRVPEACAAARSVMARAEAEVRLQRKRSFLSRDYDEATTLALEARRAAESCALHAGAARNRLRQRSTAALAGLDGWIARASVLARHVPDGLGIRAELQKAEIALGEGRNAFDRAEYERAEEAAARGRALTFAAVASMDRFFDSYSSDPRRASWKRWVAGTIRESQRTRKAAIIVDKLRRQLLVMKGTEELASYPVDLGIAAIEFKTRAGDEATPEGRYRVTEVRGPGQTRYHRALMLDYPNAEDQARFRRLRRAGEVTASQEIGGLIEIHGKGGRGQDWTQGCVALENSDMDELVSSAGVGTMVTIVGTVPDGAIP
jgi:lipoprotein-anchoring transpeptidase ErfK/SrfK